jgi:hypothetical protein
MTKILNQMMGAAVLATLLIAGTALAQERAQADVQIQSIAATQGFGPFPSLSQRLTCDVTVYSFHDDSAANVVLNVLLPVEVTVISVPTACAAIPSNASNGQWHGSVQCHLGTFDVGDSKTIRIITTLPRLPNVAKTFSAFAWSMTPDPQLGNNYRETTATP